MNRILSYRLFTHAFELLILTQGISASAGSDLEPEYAHVEFLMLFISILQ